MKSSIKPTIYRYTRIPVSYTHLGMLTVNALAAANRIIIPVQAEYLPAKGLEQLLSTVSKVKRQINPKLQIDGILLTMVASVIWGGDSNRLIDGTF